MSLADVKVHVFDDGSYGCCGREMKNFCDMTDMLAPVSNSTIVAHH